MGMYIITGICVVLGILAFMWFLEMIDELAYRFPILSLIFLGGLIGLLYYLVDITF